MRAVRRTRLDGGAGERRGSRPWRGGLRLLLWAVVALVSGRADVHAQASPVRTFVTPGTTVGVGASFVLNVEVSGAQAVDRDVELPDLPFAQYLGSSSQSSVRMVNGQTTVSMTLQYRYQALTQGTHTIPAFEVVADGRRYSTEPIELTISGGGSGPATSQDPTVEAENLFITAEASRTSVRVGEPLIVEYRIWTRVDVTNFGMTTVPEPEGFWVEDLTPGGSPDVEELTRDGLRYATAVIRRVALIPTGPGTRTLEPIGVEAQVRVRRDRDPFESLFGRSSLFGTTSVPTTVLSNPLTVDVEPLPGGRPEPFSGVVGDLRASASLDRDSVDANEAVTLSVRVSGDGNLRAVEAPELELPSDFEVFPPEVTEAIGLTGAGLGGSKTFEYVLIPRAPGSREIPPIRFSYFDTADDRYRVASTDPIPLTVAGTLVEGPGALTRAGVEQLREDIRFIRLGSLQLEPVDRSILSGVGFWILALLPLAGIGGAMALRRHWDLLEGDVAYARGRRAGRLAKKRLGEARRLAEAGEARAFYAEVARALTGLVSDRLNLAEAGLSQSELDRALERAGVAEAVRADVRECLRECDRQRFAPPGSDPLEESRFLDRVGELMVRLDRGMR